MIKPCNKFYGNSPKQQLKHIKSELNEIKFELLRIQKAPSQSIYDKIRDNLADEITDAKTALATLEKICGFLDEEMEQSEKRVIEKNERRGYYNDEKASD